MLWQLQHTFVRRREGRRATEWRVRKNDVGPEEGGSKARTRLRRIRKHALEFRPGFTGVSVTTLALSIIRGRPGAGRPSAAVTKCGGDSVNGKMDTLANTGIRLASTVAL